MKSVPHLVIAGAVCLIVLGVPFGLYALLTRGQRRVTREICVAARQHGWKYRRNLLQGDPTAFRIEGQCSNGLAWIMKSQGTSGYDPGWAVRLGLRFPALAGAEGVTEQSQEKLTDWPAAAVQPHSMLRWRDASGLHLQARLPGPPNLATISHFLGIADRLVSQMRSPATLPARRTLIDRVFGRFM